MKYTTLLDLTRQAKILSGTTANFGGSITLDENLVVSGNTSLTYVLNGSIENRVLSVNDEGLIQTFDFEDRMFYTLEAGPNISIELNNDKVLITSYNTDIGTGSTSGLGRVVETYISTDGQTTITTVVPFNSDYLDIFINGARLNESEYTTTLSHNIILNEPLSDDQIIDIVIYVPGAGGGSGGGSITDLDFNATNGNLTLTTLLGSFITNLDGRYSLSGGDEYSDYGLTGVLDGVNTVFTTTYNFVSGSSKIYLNGIRQIRDDQYTETGSDEITFTIPPFPTDDIIADYKVS